MMAIGQPTIASASPVPALAAAEVPAAAAPSLVPVPASLVTHAGDDFLLTATSRIVLDTATVSGVRQFAEKFAAPLRTSTGYPLPVVSSAAANGDIVLRVGDPGQTGDEAYRLQVGATGAVVTAATAHGLFNGLQSLKQLFPVWSSSPTRVTADWVLPGVEIVDKPRYAYRGMMLDIARHFHPVQTAKELVDQLAAYKINVLHLHLSDDQGFRVKITGRPEITSIGAQYSINGDPGGYWTQAEFLDFVAYAADRFIDVIPEVDSPGHNNALIMSYADTHPDVNCSNQKPPIWNETSAVGYSAMCPESENTWKILGDITAQLSDLSGSKYYNIGGDEVPTSILTHDRYDAFVEKISSIVRAQGKIPMGWADISSANFPALPGGVNGIAQYWANGTPSGTAGDTGRLAVQKGLKVLMSPANLTYLDMKYSANVPATLGLSWAGLIEEQKAYNWDPATLIPARGTLPAVTESDIIGVEAPLWSETLVTQNDIEYMTYPRLPALAEVAWSPQANRVYADFSTRLAAQAARWQLQSTNFFPTAQIPWQLDALGTPAWLSPAGVVSGEVAVVAAPSRATTAVTAVINWGDGSTSPGTVTGNASTATSINGLYSVSGTHTYSTAGPFAATVTVSASGTASRTVPFSVTAAAASPAGAPTAVTAVASDAAVALTWNAPASDGGSAVTGYLVTPWKGAVRGTPIATGSTATSLTIPELINGTAYSFTVAARTAVGAGASSDASAVVTPARVPNPSTTISAVISGGAANVTWGTVVGANPGSAITGYSLTTFIDGVAQTPVDIAGVGTRTYTLPALQVGKLYRFQVVSVNALGRSVPSPKSLPVGIKAGTTVGLSVDRAVVPVGTPATATVSVTVSDAGSTAGTVAVQDGSKTLATAPVTAGSAVVTLPSTVPAGAHSLVATFTPANPATVSAASSAAVPFEVHFVDVAPPTETSPRPFYADILWLATDGISTGNPDGTFKPADSITRQAMAAFLYRYANPGRTAPVCTTKPFPDIAVDNQFCGYISWLAGKGIASGFEDGKFYPNKLVDRQAMAAFLFRLVNPGVAQPVCQTAPFSDVAVGNQFCGAIEWLVGKGITTGFADGKFRPASTVARDATAAFLHRMSAAGLGRQLGILSFDGTSPVSAGSPGLFPWGANPQATPALTVQTYTDIPGYGPTKGLRAAATRTSASNYSGFSYETAAVQDWSAYDGFAFWFKGNASGKTLQYELKLTGTSAGATGLYVSNLVDDSSDWKLVKIKWSSLTRKSGNTGPVTPDPSKAWGFAVTLSSANIAFDYGFADWHLYIGN